MQSPYESRKDLLRVFLRKVAISWQSSPAAILSPLLSLFNKSRTPLRHVALSRLNPSRYSAERARMFPLVLSFLQLSSKVSKPMDSPISASANAIFIRVQGTFSVARAPLIAGIVSTALSSASLCATKYLTSGSVFLRASTKPCWVNSILWCFKSSPKVGPGPLSYEIGWPPTRATARISVTKDS